MEDCASYARRLETAEKVKQRQYDPIPDSIHFTGTINKEVGDIVFIGGEYANYICATRDSSSCSIQNGLRLLIKSNKIMMYNRTAEVGTAYCRILAGYCDKPDSVFKTIIIRTTISDTPKVNNASGRK
jgi:hypothetical protein